MRHLDFLLIAFFILSAHLQGCNIKCENTEVIEKQHFELSDYLMEELRINLSDHGIDAFSPSTLIIKGVYGKKHENFAFYDTQLQKCFLFSLEQMSVQNIFEIPKQKEYAETYILEVISPDSILYFNNDDQSLNVCNSQEIRQTIYLQCNFGGGHSYFNIQPLNNFLRSIDGYVGFDIWVNFGKGGPDVDYDALMDKRNMVAFFKLQGDSLVNKVIPIRPFLKRKEFRDLIYVDKPFFEVNSSKREVLVFHTTADTVYTYNWDNQEIKKYLITGTKVKLVPPKVPSKGSASDIMAMYETQERGHHNLYFDSHSGKYVRYLVKEFPALTRNGMSPQPKIRMLQILSENFTVETEMDFPEEYGIPAKVNGSVYLRKFDDKKRELIIYKFELPADNKEVTDASF
jgi:hypothetical protein